MYNSKMYELGSKRSVIRELFEFGKKRAAEVGADKVYDFSLGNPNVPAPECVREAIAELNAVKDTTLLHGYTSAQVYQRAFRNGAYRRFDIYDGGSRGGAHDMP